LGDDTLTPNTDDNRRGNLRVSCNVPVRCELSGESFEGSLKDVSPRGMRLELGRRLNKGDVIWIHRPSVSLEPVQALVRWCRRHAHRQVVLAGLELQMSDSDVSRSWAQPILSTFEFLHPLAIELIPAPTPLDLNEVVLEPQTEPAAKSEPEVVDATTREEPPPEVHKFMPEDSDLSVPDVLHMEVEPVVSPEVWDQLLSDAQQRLNHKPQKLFNKLLKGFREFAFEDTASVEERRRCLRLTCHYEVNLPAVGQAIVLDLSAAGMGFLTERKQSRGSALVIDPPPQYAGLGSLQSQVRYCRPFRDRFRVGIEFRGSLLPTWASPALKELGFNANHLDQKRRYVRAQTALPVEVRDWRGEYEVATLLDLSRGGTLLRTSKSWEIGEALRLILGPIGYLPTLFLSAVVLHQRPDPEGWLVNLSFIDAGGTNLARLDLYIKTILTRSQS